MAPRTRRRTRPADDHAGRAEAGRDGAGGGGRGEDSPELTAPVCASAAKDAQLEVTRESPGWSEGRPSGDPRRLLSRGGPDGRARDVLAEEERGLVTRRRDLGCGHGREGGQFQGGTGAGSGDRRLGKRLQALSARAVVKVMTSVHRVVVMASAVGVVVVRVSAVVVVSSAVVVLVFGDDDVVLAAGTVVAAANVRRRRGAMAARDVARAQMHGASQQGQPHGDERDKRARRHPHDPGILGGGSGSCKAHLNPQRQAGASHSRGSCASATEPERYADAPGMSHGPSCPAFVGAPALAAHPPPGRLPHDRGPPRRRASRRRLASALTSASHRAGERSALGPVARLELSTLNALSCLPDVSRDGSDDLTPRPEARFCFPVSATMPVCAARGCSRRCASQPCSWLAVVPAARRSRMTSCDGAASGPRGTPSPDVSSTWTRQRVRKERGPCGSRRCIAR